jgi:hypothetical protein
MSKNMMKYPVVHPEDGQASSARTMRYDPVIPLIGRHQPEIQN